MADTFLRRSWTREARQLIDPDDRGHVFIVNNYLGGQYCEVELLKINATGDRGLFLWPDGDQQWLHADLVDDEVTEDDFRKWDGTGPWAS